MGHVLFEGLNDAQRDAVLSQHPRLLCLAGAGTGKTRTLTHRIAYLNENRVSCNNMLALTFTRLAGVEMKQRIIKLVGERSGKKLFCNTFHSFCVKVLRSHGRILGYDEDFSIYDQDDTLDILNAIINEFNYKLKPSTINEAMNMDIQIFASKYGLDGDMNNAIKEYQYRLLQNNAFDFEGLIQKVIELFEKRPDICMDYHDLYEYVFVDEFQDTNDSQWKIIQMINPRNLFVVGDDFQAIYGWRNANINIILGLEKDSEWQTIKLEENYRSSRQIVEASNQLIKYNVQTDKKLIARYEGPVITYQETKNDEQESSQVAVAIASGESKFFDTAVLARTNRQLGTVKSILDKYEIPCMIVNSSNDPLDVREIRSVLAYLDLYINPKDDMAFRRAINYPDMRVPSMQMQQLELEATINESYLYEQYVESDYYDKEFVDSITAIESKSEYILGAFDALITSLGLIKRYESQNLQNKLQDIINAKQRIYEWACVQDSLGEDIGVSAFMKWLKIRDIQEKLVEHHDAVKVMTVHAAKGLEFDSVYVVGMNQDCFPNRRSDIQEERRLFYVAVTRAKRNLTISRPATVTDWSGRPSQANESQFIKEMKSDMTGGN